MFSKGFTIIEVVVAIFILSIAIIGVYNAFSIVVILTSDTIDRFTAAYLTQEGMEIVRNIRDNNWVLGNDWRCGLADVAGSTEPCDVGSKDCASSGCEADYKTMGTDSSPLPPYGTNGNYLNIDADGFYSYNAVNNKETKFKRKITIEPIIMWINGREVTILRVSVQVSWDEKPTILSSGCHAGDDICMPTSLNYITAEEYLYNWY